MTRVFVLADSMHTAESLAALIADDSRLDVVGISSLADFTGRLFEETHADVAMVNRVPETTLRRVSCPVVLLTDEPVDSWDFSGNVKAWLSVHSTPAEATAALIAAGSGLTVLTAAQAESVLNVIPEVGADTDLVVEHLTPRETQVLRMMGHGYANKEIADQLRISENTVKFHVASILGKLNAASRTEAVARGMRRGLIPI